MIQKLLASIISSIDNNMLGKKLVAVGFTGIMFYIAAVVFIPSMAAIGSFAKNESQDVEQILDKFNEVYDNILGYEGNFLKNKGAYIELNGFMAAAMGQRQMNDIIKLDNGHVTEISEPQETVAAAAQMKELYDRQTEKGKHFLFVLAPCQIPENEDILPPGYNDYSNQNADDLVGRLQEEGIPVLDLRKKMQRDGIGYTEAFFVTDHHWRSETAFWAYTEIVDYLVRADIMEPVDARYVDIGAFHVEVYEDWYLGPTGRRTGSSFAGVDDFSVIWPEFATDIRLEVPTLGIFKQGEFGDVVYDLEDNKKDFFVNLLYDHYTYGGHNRKYFNGAAPNKLKVMAVADSFAWSSAIYLPLVVSYDEMDMRYFGGNFAEYYAGYDPDVLLVFVNTASAAESANTNYDFFQ